MSTMTAIRAAALSLSLAVVLAPAAAVADSHGKIMTEGGSARLGDLTLEHAWTRATPPKARAGGGYLTITNHGSEADRLISGKADFAKRTEIHEMAVIDDVMKMRKLDDGLEIPAGGTATLKPGGYHVMFMGMTEGLTEGTVVDVTLTFAKAGDVVIRMPVSKVGARSLGGETMDHSKTGHDHSGMKTQ